MSNEYFSVTSALDEGISDLDSMDRRYRFPKPVPELYPTEASVQWRTASGLLVTEGGCNRAIWYRLKKYTEVKERDPRFFWIWSCGRWWEERGTEVLKHKDLLLAASIKFKWTPPAAGCLTVSGEMDNVVKGNLKEDGEHEKIVIDFKSAGGSYYTRKTLIGNKSTKPFPKVSNLLQLMVYMAADPSFDYGKLVYLLRDDMSRTEFNIKMRTDPVRKITHAVVNNGNYFKYNLEELIERYRLVSAYYHNNELPPQDYSWEYSDEEAEMMFDAGLLSKTAFQKHTAKKADKAGHMMCRFCSFRVQCEQDAGKKFRELDVYDSEQHAILGEQVPTTELQGSEEGN